MWKAFPEAREKAWDHSEKRIADMDSGHVSFQVMSHLAGFSSSNPASCRAANNEMGDAIKKNPDRLGGFAALPMAHPKEAAEELERAVKELGFLGALVDNHLEDMTHYDDERFWPVFEVAERLDVPIYLHPSPPSQECMQSRFAGNYPPQFGLALATGVWGWHENEGLHILKLFAAGLFDRFPKLKIVIGHMGEMLPFMLERVQEVPFFRKKEDSKNMSQVWAENIWVTTSGVVGLKTLAMLLQVTQVDHILYSVDYPFKSNESGWKFIQELGKSSLVSEQELDMISYLNAEKLLNVNVK